MAVEPDREYTPAELAPLGGLSAQSIRELCGTQAVRHRRVGPKGGKIVIRGQWWLDYLKACEAGPGSGRPARAPAAKAATTPRPPKTTAADLRALAERTRAAAK